MRSSTRRIISSGFWRACLGTATVGGGSSTRTWSACAPRRPSATPNSTRCPCRSAVVPAGNADECTKTSPPSSRARKPYPLSESYHLTLPVGTRRPHVEENRTTSDQATDRMLWALLRLSVRDARSQLRYRRLPATARPALGDTTRSGDTAGPETQPGPASHVRWCWDGMACKAGVRVRSTPVLKIALGPIPSTYTQKHAPQATQAPPETPPKCQTARGNPGPSG